MSLDELTVRTDPEGSRRCGWQSEGVISQVGIDFDSGGGFWLVAHPLWREVVDQNDGRRVRVLVELLGP